MEYRIVSNGRDFRIQRKDGGFIIKIRKTLIVFWSWEYVWENILSWQDMRRYDLEAAAAQTVVNGFGDSWSESIACFSTEEFARQVMKERIAEDEYQKKQR